MCGIYAVRGVDAGPKVLAGLQRLEYRGYDSWGVAVTNSDRLQLEKHVGRIGQVKALELPAGELAIGHTRWATHGGITEANAHPHLAASGAFAVVHNGVAENHQELKTELMATGYSFLSQTDTEVIVAMLEVSMVNLQQREISMSVFQTVMKKISGRNTVVLITKTGELWAFRAGSPLIIAKGEDVVVLSSDVVSASIETTSYAALDNQQLLRIDTEGQVSAFELETLEPLSLVFSEFDETAVAIGMEGFSDFMSKEIHEQGKVLHHVMDQEIGDWQQLRTYLKEADAVYTVAAGSASYAAGQLAFYLRQAGIFVTELKAYEAKSYQHFWNHKTVCIALSQSGETADTNEVVEWMKAAGATIISLVNMNGSTLQSLSNLRFGLQVGPEIGVASTKALTGMMAWARAVSLFMSEEEMVDIKNKVATFEQSLATWIESSDERLKIRKLAEEFRSTQQLFILGRGQLYYPALESALKLKEISYVHAEAFSGGELKHGVLALIEEGTPVLCLVTNDDEQANMNNSMSEIKARGGVVIGVSAQPNTIFDRWIEVPATLDFAAVASIIPAQLLTYELAQLKGLDADKPRNLAKSVTVK